MASNSEYSVLRWGIAGAGKISTDFLIAVNADSSDKHKVISTFLLIVIVILYYVLL